MATLIAGDTGSPINVIAQDESGSPFSLQNTTGVVLNVLFPDWTIRKTFTLTVQTGTLHDDAGNVLANPNFWAQYQPQSSDFTIDGSYDAQAVATFSNGTVSCLPFTITVGKRL